MMIEVLNEIKNKIQEDVTQEDFKTFLDSIELTDVEKGRQAYREFRASCKEVGIGKEADIQEALDRR